MHAECLPRFAGALLSRWPLRACCYRSGSAAAARSRAYLAVKRSEAADFADHDADYECFHHFTKI